MGFVPAYHSVIGMRETFALATVHALVQAAGGAEELQGTAAEFGAIRCLKAGSSVLTEILTGAWRRRRKDQEERRNVLK